MTTAADPILIRLAADRVEQLAGDPLAMRQMRRIAHQVHAQRPPWHRAVLDAEDYLQAGLTHLLAHPKWAGFDGPGIMYHAARLGMLDLHWSARDKRKRDRGETAPAQLSADAYHYTPAPSAELHRRDVCDRIVKTVIARWHGNASRKRLRALVCLRQGIGGRELVRRSGLHESDLSKLKRDLRLTLGDVL